MLPRKDFELKTPGGNMLGVNVCQSVTTELYGLKDDIKPDEVAAFVRKSRGDFSLGWVFHDVAAFIMLKR